MTLFNRLQFKDDFTEVSVLVLLKSHLSDQNLFNENRAMIASTIETLLMKRHSVKKAYETTEGSTLAQVLKGLTQTITPDWKIYTAEELQELDNKKMALKLISETISKNYGKIFLDELTRVTVNKDNDEAQLNKLADNIYPENKKDLTTHLQAYKDKYAALAEDRELQAQIIASKARQVQENIANAEWARLNLTHIELLKKIAKSKSEYAAYMALLNTSGTAPKVEDLSEMLAQSDSDKTNKNLDTRIFNLINTMAIGAAMHGFHSFKNGETSKERRLTPPQAQYASIISGTLGALFVGLIITNVFTIITPLIPLLAHKSLDALYTTVFSGFEIVGPHHHFSMYAIYLISVGFMLTLDACIGYAVYKARLEIKTYDKLNSSKLIEKDICEAMTGSGSNKDNIKDATSSTGTEDALLTAYQAAKPTLEHVNPQVAKKRYEVPTIKNCV